MRWVRVFEAEVSLSAKELLLYYEKRPVVCGGVGRAAFLQGGKPDGFLVVGGVHVDLEMKSQEMHGSFALDEVSEKQEEEWRRLGREGAPGFLLINMRRKPAGKVKEGKTTPDIRAWAMPTALWPYLKHELADIGRKSIPYEWLLDPLRFASVPRLPRDRGRRPAIWDLRTGLSAAAKLLSRPIAKGLIQPDLPTMLSLALADRDFTREVAADLATISLGE